MQETTSRTPGNLQDVDMSAPIIIRCLQFATKGATNETRRTKIRRNPDIVESKDVISRGSSQELAVWQPPKSLGAAHRNMRAVEWGL